MTCTRVTAIIDAGPVADCSRIEIDAAVEHARRCAACGPLLAAATALAADLRMLPSPSVPCDLAPAVMERITKRDGTRSAPVMSPTTGQTGMPVVSDWPAWAATAMGAALVIAVTTLLGDVGMLLPRARAVGFAAGSMAGQPSGAFALIAGLVVYTAGLLLPVHCRRGYRPS